MQLAAVNATALIGRWSTQRLITALGSQRFGKVFFPLVWMCHKGIVNASIIYRNAVNNAISKQKSRTSKIFKYQSSLEGFPQGFPKICLCFGTAKMYFPGIFLDFGQFCKFNGYLRTGKGICHIPEFSPFSRLGGNPVIANKKVMCDERTCFNRLCRLLLQVTQRVVYKLLL